jgi:hypothetical protein
MFARGTRADHCSQSVAIRLLTYFNQWQSGCRAGLRLEGTIENDTIRSSGGNTLVDVWIDGKMRGVCVTRGAIEMHLGLTADQSAGMSEGDRCEFVRTNLALVMKSAKERLRDTSAAADYIIIDTGQLPVRAADRRKGERRKSDRRKADRPQLIPPQGDRRRGPRRKGERRGTSGETAKS